MELAPLLLLPLLLLLLPAAAVAAGGDEPAPHPGYAHGTEEACGVVVLPAPERREEFDGGRIVDISHYYRADMPA
ncbi:kynurenine formamidase-like isoform X3 [Panicum miliaceum]|uniref:Kynurenine formamidase-like isoform X3 n=1 Tax=Panicum miliaceum TaxID=4540 RepID=A0A3L6T7X0_PANMI|nr:kynurenine formamidase-like isoform X3 [Panicum miliaceum]